MSRTTSSSRWQRITRALGFGSSNNRPRKLAQQPGRRTLRVEPLEDRSLLSVCLWDGGGSTTNWNNADNWVNQSQQHVAPIAGDSLIFQGTGVSTNNDFPAGTTFETITFADDGFNLTGHDLCLTGGILAESDATVSLNVALGSLFTLNVDSGAELTISGVLSGDYCLGKVGPGTLTLAGANANSGGTVIADGTLKLENDAALAPSDHGLALIGPSAVLDLNGHSPSVGMLGLIDGSIVDSTANPGTLTGSIYVVLNGSIEVSLTAMDASLIKGTDGSVTLSGNNNYWGPTLVCGGQLTLRGPDAWNPVLYYGGTDVRDGRLVLDYDYSGGSTPAAGVKDALTYSYNGGLWDRGQFLSSTAAANNMTLGWNDDTTAQKLTVMYTTLADADLNGSVDYADFDAWYANVGRDSPTWSQADFDYDGEVSYADFDLWIANAGASVAPGPSSVLAIARLGSQNTSSNTLMFAVLFSKGVTGVDTNDFTLDRLGVSGEIAAVSSIDQSSPHAAYLVAVTDVSGNGTLGLNLVDDNSIQDADNVSLVGLATDDGSFTGDAYTASSPFVWSGGGMDSDWTTPDNWSCQVAPTDGSSLRFAGTQRTGTNNGFPAGTTFASIEIASDDFVLAGNEFTVSERVTVPLGVTEATISADGVMLDGSVTIDVADVDGVLTISGDLYGDGSLTKTGDGQLALHGQIDHTGGTTVAAGGILLPPVFSESLDSGVTLTSTRPNALLVADPTPLGDAFNVTAQGLADGTATLGSDGILHWQPGTNCQPGTYTATATYSYTGGSQTKTFSVNITDEPIRPGFAIDNVLVREHDWHGHDQHITAVIENLPNQPWSVQLHPAFDGGRPVAYELTAEPPFDCLPPNAAVDSDGLFTCTLSGSDAYRDYQFKVNAIGANGKIDKRTVVIAVNVIYQGWLPTVDAPKTYKVIDQDSNANAISLIASPSNALTLAHGELVIDVQPSHGTLEGVSSALGQVSYTPDPGYNGLDEFYYHWVYDTYDYYATPPLKTGTASSNVSRGQIQVGEWVHLTADAPYEPGKTLVAVDGSTTATLTLQNPRGDQVSTTGYWVLKFNRNVVHVFGPEGEILPTGISLGQPVTTIGSTIITTVEDTTQITLTIVGVSAGISDLEACWLPYASQLELGNPPARRDPWHWAAATEKISVMVPEVFITRDGVDITGKTSTVVVGERINLKGIFFPDDLKENIAGVEWVVPGNRVQDYQQDRTKAEVTPLDDLKVDDIRFYWIAGGTWPAAQTFQVTYTVNIADWGPVSNTTKFEVLRPTATVDVTTTILNPQVRIDPPDSLDATLEFGHHDPGIPALAGITWTGTVYSPAGGPGQIAFVQLVIADRALILDDPGSTTQVFSSDGARVLDDRQGIQYGGPEPTMPRTTSRITRNDSPSQGFSAAYKEVCVHDQFFTYLMYRPQGGIWVTLRRIDWFWTGQAYKVSSCWEGGGFDAVTANVDTTELPVWDNCITNLHLE
jgi:autotransporter-associated beta strand protein